MKGVCVVKEKGTYIRTPSLVWAGLSSQTGQAFRNIRNKLETYWIANCELFETRNYTLAKFTHVKCNH